VLLLPALLLWGPCMVVGNMIGGILTDKIPIRYLLGGVQALLAVTMLWIREIASPWQVFVYIFMAGMSVGMNFTSFSVIWAGYFDLTGSYDRALLLLLVLPVISGLAALFAAPPAVRNADAGRYSDCR